jgi:rhamnosyltransferase
VSGRPSVSIVIPTRDGAATLPQVLAAIGRQQVEPPPEVVAVDSGSSDGTVELLRGRVDRLLEVEAESFDHGLTRNRAIAAASGELVVLLVQDAVPAAPTWLATLTAPFANDPRLAGTFARQLPRPDASRLTRMALGRWVAAGAEGRVAEVDSAEALAALTPEQRHLRCAFDNVCSCLRREVWQDHPFPAATIAEDLAWARQVLLAGWRLRYVPEAAVVHSHERSLAYELGRTRLVHRRLVELFGLRTIPSLSSLLRSWAVTLLDHHRCLCVPGGDRPGPREVARALALAVIWPLGQYLGGRDAVRRGPV